MQAQGKTFVGLYEGICMYVTNKVEELSKKKKKIPKNSEIPKKIQILSCFSKI